MSDASQFQTPVKSDGVHVPGQNDYPSSVGVIAHTPNAAPSSTDATKRITAVTGASNRTSMHVGLTDENANPYSITNPLYVAPVDGKGANINNYKLDTINAQTTSANIHSFTPSGNCKVREISVHSVLEGRFDFRVGGTVIDSAYTTPSNPNGKITFPVPFAVPSGVVCSLTKVNRGLFQTDMVSTIKGEYDA